MAKRIVDEEMRFSIVVNGNEAQKELLDLEKSTRKLTATNKALRTEKHRLDLAGKKNSKEYKEATEQIKKNNIALRENKARMLELQKQIGLTSLTYGQLVREKSRLNLLLRNAIPGSDQRKKWESELAAVKAQMDKLNGSAKYAKTGLQKFADGFNRYAALGASFLAVLTGVVFKIQEFIDFNGKMADAISDVQKTTGLAKSEVEDLAKSFGLLQTRTNRINLLKIAEEGGRIGIAKEEIADFVEVMNKAVVALGDSFPGGVEETASKLGKLKLLFKETKDLGVDEAYNAIGSAINELGADGVATEINIANFATRVGSLPDALKPAISDALALGAAFEESGIEAEVASRAYNIFLKQASTETDKFARVMGISAKEVENMINANPLEFLMEFSKGLKGLDPTDISKILDYIGVNADGANKVLGAISNNLQLFRDRLQLSNQAMAEGTSLIDEYNIKNNNFAATLEKISKRIRGVFVNKTVVEWLTEGTEWFGKFIGATDDASGSVRRFRDFLYFLVRVLAIALIATQSYNAALRITELWTKAAYRSTLLYTVAQKAMTISARIGTGAIMLLKAAYFAITGQITRATAVMRIFNTVTKLNPIGLILAAVATLTAAYFAFREEAKIAVTTQELLNDAMNKASERTASAIEKVNTLREVVEDETASEEARKKAVEALNRIVPNYNKDLELTKEALERGKVALDKYIESLQKKAEAQFLADQVSIKSKQLMEQENASLESHLEWYDQLWIGIKNFGDIADSAADAIAKAEQRKQKAISFTKKELEAAKEAYKGYIKENPDAALTEEEFVNTFDVPGDDKDDAKLKEAQRISQELLKVQREENELKNSLIQDNFQRELAQLEEQHRQKMEDLQKQKIDKEDLSKEELAINESLKKQEAMQAKKFQYDKGALIEKGYQEDLALMEETFKKQAAEREVRQQEELNAVGNNEKAKERLKEKHRQEDLEAEQAHVKEVIQALKLITESGQFEGVNLSLLSNEEAARMQALIDQLVLKLRELEAAKNDVSGNGLDEFSLGDATANVDIFGMTAAQWEQTLDNLDQAGYKFELIRGATNAAMSLYQEYSNLMSAKEAKQVQEFEQKQTEEARILKQKLDSRLISQKQYDAAIAASEAELEKKKAEIAVKQAKRDRAMALANIAWNTAQAIMAIWKRFPEPITAGILTAAVTALGALQAATVLSTPMPVKGYQDGLYNVTREQDGKPFKARFGGESRSGLVDFPTVFMAGEEGKTRPEMIINGQDYANFSESFKDSLYRELGRVKGFADGYYQSSTTQPSFNTGDSTAAGKDYLLFAAALNRNSEIMERLERDGLVAYLKRDYENARKMKEDIADYDRLRNKNQF